jgi:hypothetical protein
MSHAKTRSEAASLKAKGSDDDTAAVRAAQPKKKNVPPLISLASGMVAGSSEAFITVGDF